MYARMLRIYLPMLDAGIVAFAHNEYERVCVQKENTAMKAELNLEKKCQKPFYSK